MKNQEVGEMGDVVRMDGVEDVAPEQTRSRGPALNAVQLLGRLAADPEMRYRPDGKPVTELRLVTNERADPEYHDIVTYDGLAKACGEHLRKGAQVFVSGRLHGQVWKAQDGSGRRRVVVIAESVQFLSRSREAEA
jgi:single-strand DNA-binding protein